MQAVLFWEPAITAPAKRSNDVIAGTEFLSVFINGAMAPRPLRRRGSHRRSGHQIDSMSSESKHNEAFIYRISRAPPASKPTVIIPKTVTSSTPRESSVRYYPISQKALNRSQNQASLIDELGTVDEISSKLTSQDGKHSENSTMLFKTNKTGKAENQTVNRKVIGVSVTSTVEATPYKIRIEHFPVGNSMRLNTRSSITDANTTSTSSTSTTPSSTTVTTISTKENSLSSIFVTPPSTNFVTEDIGNIVSESSRSEFSVDESSSQIVWQKTSIITPKPETKNEPGSSTPSHPESFDYDSATSGSGIKPIWRDRNSIKSESESSNQDSAISGTSLIPVQMHDYQVDKENYDSKGAPELGGSRAHYQGRKVSRHYDGSFYDASQPRHHNVPIDSFDKTSAARVSYGESVETSLKGYSEPEKVYQEPAKVYGEPAKIYGEPSKVYGEPSKVYSKPAQVYGEPEKVYSEPARIYSEPAKVYSEPAKVYSEPSKVYASNGQPVDHQRVEPVEQNYEVDEAVSVGSNGNVHGPQPVTDATNNADSEDGRKVGYVVEGRNYRKYRVEERTADGFIVGEYGVVSHDDGSLRGVRYTADGTINPRLIYDALMKFLAL